MCSNQPPSLEVAGKDLTGILVCIVAILGSNAQSSLPCSRVYFHSDLAPGTVFGRVGRHITQHILILHLCCNLPGGLPKTINRCPIRMASRDLGELSNEGTPQINGVHLDVRFAEKSPDVTSRIAAVVVYTVGDKQQGLSGVQPRGDFRQAEVQRIVQGCRALRAKRSQTAFDTGNIGGEILRKPCIVAELDQEKLVLPGTGLQK